MRVKPRRWRIVLIPYILDACSVEGVQTES
jgi:hypothetical protein